MIYLILSMTLIISCNSSNEMKNDMPYTKDFNENEIGNPVINIIRENIPLVRASSKELIKNPSADAFLKGDVKADFFNSEGLHVSRLYSDAADINQKTNNLFAYGNVKVISDDSVKLFSNSILWDNQYELIISHDSVMFTTMDNDTMYGVGFESDIDLSQWKIKKPHGTKTGFKND